MDEPRPASRLPERPSLDQLKRQAKELRATGGHPSLADAQRELARRYGFSSWPSLKRAVDAITLRRLIEDGEPEPVRRLLDGSPALARVTFDDGSTPLHVAAGENRPEIVELLARHGAPLEARYARSAHNALSWAVTTGAFDAANKLVELGVEPDLFCAAGLGLLDRVRSFWHDGKLARRPSRTGSSRYTEDGQPLPRRRDTIGTRSRTPCTSLAVVGVFPSRAGSSIAGRIRTGAGSPAPRAWPGPSSREIASCARSCASAAARTSCAIRSITCRRERSV
jgi:hypothetical protein